MADTCMGRVEINHPALHLMPLTPLEVAHQRIRELESAQSQLQEEVHELRSNIQSSNEWRLQTEEMMRRMMEQVMEEREVSSRSVATRWSRHRSDRFATRCLVLSISCFLTFNTLCFLTFGP